MKVNPAIFRAYDVRGIYEKDMTLEVTEHIGKALGSRLMRANPSSEPMMAVGRDGRLSGKKLSGALCRGILSTGCRVIDVGMVPSPVVYYASKKLSQGNCVVVTGSHNPAEYNGLKMVLQDAALSAESIQCLVSEVLEEDYCLGEGELSQSHLVEQYITEVCQQNSVVRALKVVVDCGNGVTGDIAPKLLQRLGCEVVPLFADIDGHFPNHHPDPSQAENLLDLQSAVLQQQADIGIAYDGDGDRIGVIDSGGNIINADRLLMLYAKQVLAANPKAEILYDVKCTANLPRWIEKHGGKATMCRTGHSFVKKALKESNAQLAGEMSGHIFFNDSWYGFDDALYSSARLLSILSGTKKSSYELFSELPDSVNTPEINIHFTEGEHIKAMQKIKQDICFPSATISTLDGVRVEFADGWGLVRSSNTTPVLVLRFEAKDEIALKQIQQRFKPLLAPHCPYIPF